MFSTQQKILYLSSLEIYPLHALSYFFPFSTAAFYYFQKFPDNNNLTSCVALFLCFFYRVS